MNPSITSEERLELLREQAVTTAEIIDALEKIASSQYWKVLEQNIFSADLLSLKSRLSKEKDTTEIFRLQGEIARSEKYDLNKLILEKRNTLLNIKQQLNA